MKPRHPALQSTHITVYILYVVFLADHSLIIECDQSVVGNTLVLGEGFVPAVTIGT